MVLRAFWSSQWVERFPRVFLFETRIFAAINSSNLIHTRSLESICFDHCLLLSTLRIQIVQTVRYVNSDGLDLLDQSRFLAASRSNDQQ